MARPGEALIAVRAAERVSSGRVPGLDGLRGLSILLVLFCHAAPTLGIPIRSALGKLAAEAEIGVDVFFVISGFLITLLLLRESDRTGSIMLGGFFARRALRLMPALAAYLVFVAMLARAGTVRATPIDWLAASTYTINATSLFSHSTTWALGHLWSLSVEEHFYLIWPVALAGLGRRRALTALMVVLAAAPTVRVVLWAAFPRALPLGLLKTFTLARLDGIGAGCLLAFGLHDPSLIRGSRGRLAVVARVSAGILLASAVLYSVTGFFEIAIRGTLKNTAIAGLVALVVTRPRSALVRALDARPMAALGALSYSLYLWQQPFFDPKSWLPMCHWPRNVAYAIGCAVASYLLIERPFLAWKRRLGRRMTTGVPRPHIDVAVAAAVRS
jgi:peptidoglycan/LPS O-acetylase OafA/YrhL